MNPIVHTERTMIREVRDRWLKTYRRKDGSWAYGDEKGVIYRRLEALDLETCTSADVASAIGNDGWTRVGCHGCGKNVPAAVSVGEEPDYESSTALLCYPCVVAAVAAFDRACEHEDCRSAPTTLGRACAATTYGSE